MSHWKEIAEENNARLAPREIGGRSVSVEDALAWSDETEDFLCGECGSDVHHQVLAAEVRRLRALILGV